MQWPERVAVFLMLLFAALVFLMGTFLNSGTNNTGNEWIGASAEIWWFLCKMFVFPLWIILRVFALIFGSRRYS